jgi:hypothetical protein
VRGLALPQRNDGVGGLCGGQRQQERCGKHGNTRAVRNHG